MKKSSMPVFSFLILLSILMGCNSSLSQSTETMQEQAALSTSTATTAQETPVETITPVPETTGSPTVRATLTPIDLKQYKEDVAEFKMIAIMESGEISLTGEIFFVDDYAVELNQATGDLEAIYDLYESKWWDSPVETYITFPDCLAWAQESADKTRETLANSQDEENIKFVMSLLEPNFIIEENEHQLIARNDYLHYEVEYYETLNEDETDRIFFYSTMNACRKSLILQQMPPFIELALLSELYDRGIVPSQIHLTISNGTTAETAIVTYEIREMTLEESMRIQAILKDIP